MSKRKIPGSVFISNLFRKKYVRSTNKYGVDLLLDPREYLEKEILSNGYYEEEVIQQLIDSSKQFEKPIVWDIGANVGLHGLSLKKAVPSTNIFCFEPYHINFTKLKNNQALNPDLHLHFFNFGLTENPKVNQIYLTDTNLGRTSFMELSHTEDSCISTLSCNGDFLVENGYVPYPNIIKIDVEGLELSVFKGCHKILSNPQLQSIVFERPTDLDPSDEVVNLLKSYGFDITLLELDRLHRETNRNYAALRKVSTEIRTQTTLNPVGISDTQS